MTDRNEIGWGMFKGFWGIIISIVAIVFALFVVGSIIDGIGNSIEAYQEKRRERSGFGDDKIDEIMRRQNEAIKNR